MKKKEKNTGKIILAAITAFIMISSVLGIINNNQQEKKTSYNGIKFKQVVINGQNFWSAKINKQNIIFHYHPSQLETIEVDNFTSVLHNSQQLVITTPPPVYYYSDFLAQISEMITQNLEQSDYIIIHGFTNSSGYAIPEFTCNNATSSLPVIEFTIGNSTNIVTKNNCITLTAKDPREYIALKDRLLFGFFGVMQ